MTHINQENVFMDKFQYTDESNNIISGTMALVYRFKDVTVANIKDVARLAGVSISTVSRVINSSATVIEHKRDAVLRAMNELQYKPNSFAKALVSNKSNTIGLVVGDLADPFFGLMMRGVEKVSNQYNKQLLVSSGHHNEEQERQAINSLIDRRCDALIIHSKALTDFQLMELLRAQTASVLINRTIPGLEHQSIYLDNRLAGNQAASYLLDNGHQRIAMVTRNVEIEDELERRQGYQDALLNHGIIPDQKLIAAAEANEEGGYLATQTLLQQKTDFTAIFAYNDAMAAGCLSALRANKIQVPNDVSVIGFDDVLLARFLHPKLTTIRYPIETMSTAAAQLALLLSGENSEKPVQQMFGSQLIVRESTRRIN